MFVCCLSNSKYVHCWKFNCFVMVCSSLRVCLILWDWCKANKNKSFLLSVVEGEKVKNQRWIYIIHHEFTREHWVLWFLCLLSEFKQFLKLNHALLTCVWHDVSEVGGAGVAAGLPVLPQLPDDQFCEWFHGTSVRPVKWIVLIRRVPGRDPLKYQPM